MNDKFVEIVPTRRFLKINFKEIYRFRELLYFFVWRDIIIRYKQTFMGIIWVVLQPVLTMVVFTIVFSRVSKSISTDIPYSLFVFSGLIPWMLFSQSLTRASDSVVANAQIISKVYFPRLLIPISASFSVLIDTLISLLIFLIIMVYFQFLPLLSIVLLPLFLILTLYASLGLSFFLSALNVMYRDLRYVVPFFISLCLFVTPVIYPAKMIPEKFSWILNLNPMTGIIEMMRFCIFPNYEFSIMSFMYSLLMCTAFFWGGLFFFNKYDKKFADVI